MKTMHKKVWLCTVMYYLCIMMFYLLSVNLLDHTDNISHQTLWRISVIADVSAFSKRTFHSFSVADKEDVKTLDWKFGTSIYRVLQLATKIAWLCSVWFFYENTPKLCLYVSFGNHSTSFLSRLRIHKTNILLQQQHSVLLFRIRLPQFL